MSTKRIVDQCSTETERSHLKERGLEYACTDLGNCERLIARSSQDLCYLCDERRWLSWDGSRWRPNKKHSFRAEQTVKGLYDEARDCKNSQGQRELTDWAKRSQAKSRIDSMMALAAERLSVSVAEFDTDAGLINCNNGLLDLASGELHPHSSDQLAMKIADAAYDKNATCPQWLAFLNEVFSGDAELVSYMQRALGYSLTGETDEHCLFIAYGLGANGKTTLFETVHDILGDYAHMTEFSTFLNTDKSDARKQEAIGRLRGVRMAVASETESTKSWKEAIVKKLTGGDTLTGAKLYGNSYEFSPTHTLWFQANHLPGVKDASHGFWRRVRVVPFNAKFDGAKVDPGLRKKLLIERDGIFAWLVEGARQYYADGLGQPPEACELATSDYRSDNDPLSSFIEERLMRDVSGSASLSSTYEAYQAWCFDEREQPTAMNFFSKGMEERGIKKRHTNKGKVFDGYKLKVETATTKRETEPWTTEESWRPTTVEEMLAGPIHKKDRPY